MASKQVCTWWRESRQRPARRLLLQVAAVALTFTVGYGIFAYPRQHLPRSALERVTGTVVGKRQVHTRVGRGGGSTSYNVMVATAQGVRQVSINPYCHRSWYDIHVGESLDGFVGHSVAVDITLNERCLFSYADYCRAYDRDRRFCSTIFGVIAAFCWVAVLGVACWIVTPTGPRHRRAKVWRD